MPEPYGPAPESDPGASSRPKIPDSVSIAVELWVVVIVGQIVALFAQTGTFVDMIRDQVRAAPQEGVPPEQVDFMTSSGFVIGVLVVTSLFLTAITALVVWFTRKGYNWARVVLSAMGVYVVVSLLFSLFGDTSPVWAMIPQVISGVAALGATVLLMRGDSETYCRAMAQARKPQPVHPPTPPYPYGQNPYGQNPYGQNLYGQNPYSQNPYERNPYGQNPYGQNPYGRSPYDPNPHGENTPYGDSEHRDERVGPHPEKPHSEPVHLEKPRPENLRPENSGSENQNEGPKNQ
ncbi:hypothetical protein [Gordonia sp. KTR9]|uniref:hypothetical protein n=1 Tax=Gordonia sp. KTR9 TaxID=337191 RepID=UPI00027DDACC|nr:hypothetical protein [Gordonia sp. KTR9]AFR47561.1 hypothetical protein KTR9_0916 [Gordonia sp. KTR9]